MEFQRTKIQTHEVRTVEIHESVTAEPMHWQYSSSRTWQPTMIRVQFQSDRLDGEAWSPWGLSGPIRVFGHNLKSDGSRGADRNESHWSMHSSETFGPHVRAILDELNSTEVNGVGMPTPFSAEAMANLETSG